MITVAIAAVVVAIAVVVVAIGVVGGGAVAAVRIVFVHCCTAKRVVKRPCVKHGRIQRRARPAHCTAVRAAAAPVRATRSTRHARAA